MDSSASNDGILCGTEAWSKRSSKVRQVSTDESQSLVTRVVSLNPSIKRRRVDQQSNTPNHGTGHCGHDQKNKLNTIKESQDNSRAVGIDSTPKRRKGRGKKFSVFKRLSRISPEQEGSDRLRVSFNPPLLAEIDQSHILDSCKKTKAIGCIMYLSIELANNDETIEKYTSIDYLAGLVREKLVGKKPEFTIDESMLHSIYDLICFRSDTMEEILTSCDNFTAARNKLPESQLLGEDELIWWGSNDSSMKKLTFLRRLLMPLCLKVTNASRDITKVLDISLADVLLQVDIPGLLSIIIDALLLRVCQLKVNEPSCTHEHLQMRILSTLHRSMQRRHCFDFDALLRGAKHILVHAPEMHVLFRRILRGHEILEHLSCEHISRFRKSKVDYKEKRSLWDFYLRKESEWSRSLLEARSSPPNMHAAKLAIRTERRLLIEEFAAKQRSKEQGGHYVVRLPGGKTISKARDHNGDLVLNEEDVSSDEFLSTAKFMNDVNTTLPRPFYESRSRPRLQQVQLSDAVYQKLKAVFFDSDGSLSDSMKRDIDTSLKHGYINFANKLCLAERHDQRWQVPVRHHKMAQNVSTRETVEKLLAGVFNPDFEKLNDIGILIGGTEDQSLHHDVARQVVSWIPGAPEGLAECPVVGWEVDRIAYNEAMASSHAPMSLIIGMGDQRTVLLGVQRDQIESLPGGRCRIFNGNGEVYDIVRETDKLVVIRAQMGCAFTGDFPHAGVRNVAPKSHEDTLMRQLNLRIMNVSSQYPNDRQSQMRAIVDVLCRFPGLDNLCRLHCSTEMVEGNLHIPANTIGFTDCEPNTPDPRCLQNDPIFNGIVESSDDSGDDDDDDSYAASETEYWIPLLCRSDAMISNSKRATSVEITPHSTPPHISSDTHNIW